MAKQNLAFLYGRVAKAPNVFKTSETEYKHGMVYLDVVRGYRSVDDHIKFVKHDYPLLIAKEPEILDSFTQWKENDVVFVKGVVTTQKLNKTSFCEHCSGKNQVVGNLVYITPIYVRKVASYDEKVDAVEDVVNNREISNQVYIYGTLLNNPKIFTTKRGNQITQYPIAINRKVNIRMDDPSIKSDYPVVKSYGEQARDDKIFLKYQSEIIVDGFLQARSITRTTKCPHCGEFYHWKDNAMELVPYTVEYINNFRTPEDVEREEFFTVEALKQQLFASKFSDELDDELKTDDVVEED